MVDSGQGVYRQKFRDYYREATSPLIPKAKPEAEHAQALELGPAQALAPHFQGHAQGWRVLRYGNDSPENGPFSIPPLIALGFFAVLGDWQILFYEEFKSATN